MPAIELGVEEIGPVEAKQLLEANEGNRKEDWALIPLYARQMAAGEWRFVGDPIRVSVTGRLLDGQNRLNAIILSDTTQKFAFIRGLPDGDQVYIDVGKKRTASDVFTMNGIGNAAAASSIVAQVIKYDAGRTMDGAFRIAHSELLAVYNGKEKDVFHRAATIGYEIRGVVPIAPSLAGTVYVLARRVADVFAVEQFFYFLREGAGMQTDDPIHSFRNWVIRRSGRVDGQAIKVTRFEMLYGLMKAWNNWATEESVTKTQLPKGGVTTSKQFDTVRLVATTRVFDRPLSEDNPVTVPRSRSAKERDRDGVSRAGNK